MRRLLLCVGFLAFHSGCNQGDAERLARIGSALTERTAELTSSISADFRDEWRDWQSRSAGRQVLQRVIQRLETDKRLAKCAIVVSLDGNTIELRGEVHSEEQRRRAVDLAESTAGVANVRDLLQVVAEAGS